MGLDNTHLTVNEVASLSGVSHFTVYYWLRTGKLAHTRFNHTYAVRRADLLAFLAGRTTTTKGT